MKNWLEANENSDEWEFERLARINLKRFQFIELLCRIADEKYVKHTK